MKRVLLFILFLSVATSGLSQSSKFNVGGGFGLDYGGIGIRVSYNPIAYFGVYGGAGFNFLTLGYNAGAQIRIAGKRRLTPFLTGMYGYNGVLLVLNNSSYSETFYGPTFGAGTEIRLGRKSNFINVELLFPIHPDLYDRVNELKNIGVVVTEPLPFAISVGFHFSIF